MRVLIVGCGYVGFCVGAELARKGHSVRGVRRSNAGDSALSAAGILPIHADITVPGNLAVLGTSYDWVVHCVSASGGNADDYERVYIEGTRNLLSWLGSAAPSKILFTSSTSVYGQTNGEWVDETSTTVPVAPTAQTILRTEGLLREFAAKNGFPAVILRVAGIYGPDRAHWIDQVRSGRARIEREERNLNMVHRDDVAGAIVAALERAGPGSTYNVADDEPVTQRALVTWLSGRLKLAMPPEADESVSSAKRGLTNKRVSNRRLKSELGYRLRFPTFREGYESILAG